MKPNTSQGQLLNCDFPIVGWIVSLQKSHVEVLTTVPQNVNFLRDKALPINFPRLLSGKQSACKARDVSSIPGLGRSPGEENDNHSSIPPGRIPWREESGGLQPMGHKELDMTEQLTLHLIVISCDEVILK